MALLMLVMGVLSFSLMNVDIFPAINIPVVMVVWSYPGLNAIDTERRLVIISERAYSTTVDGIEHMESQSMLGIGIIKVYFQPGTDIGSAIYKSTRFQKQFFSQPLMALRRRISFLTTPPTYRWRN